MPFIDSFTKCIKKLTVRLDTESKKPSQHPAKQGEKYVYLFTPQTGLKSLSEHPQISLQGSSSLISCLTIKNNTYKNFNF